MLVISFSVGFKLRIPFNVEVSVGKEVPHPNTTEQNIAYIELYYMPEDGQIPIELGRASFIVDDVVSTAIIANFSVALDNLGSIQAVAYCNLHGIWESEIMSVQ